MACSQTVPCRLPSLQTSPVFLGSLSAGQGQAVLHDPWNFIRELCWPIELSVLMEMFYSDYCLIQEPGDTCDYWAFDK